MAEAHRFNGRLLICYLPDEMNRRCRSILLVVALQNQDAVERSHQDIVDLVLLARILRHHPHENK